MAESTLRENLRSMPKEAWTLFAGTFINKFGNFLNVFLVLYLARRGYSPSQAGLALGAVGLGAAAGNMLGGHITDRLGRPKTIAVSMFASALLTLMVPLTRGIVLITMLVGLVGVAQQLYRPASGAILVDVVPVDKRVTAWALYRLAINLGMAVGPIVAGFIAERSFTLIFVGDALTSIVYGVVALALLPETRPTPKADEPQNEGYRAVLADRAYMIFLLGMFGATFVYTQSIATLPLHVKASGLPVSAFGLLIGLNAALVVVCELPLTGFTQRFASRPVMAIGLVLLGVGFGLTGAAHSFLMIGATVVAWSFAEMIYTPVASAYPGVFAPPHLRGRYQGAYGTAHTLANAVGPAVGGLLFTWSDTGLWMVCVVVGLVAAGLVLAARPRQEHQAEHLVAPVVQEPTGVSVDPGTVEPSGPAD
jgi:MFS family permease